MEKILIADDSEYVRGVIREFLEMEKYDIYEAENGMQTLKAAEKILPDLIILDVIMPVENGFNILETIRSRPKVYGTPMVLMLTSKTETKDIICGFSMGADDYLKKPFDGIELVLRIKALLKRRNSEMPKFYKYKNITVDIENYTVSENGNEVKLTKKEYELLCHMIINKGIIQNRDKIMEAVWNKPYIAGNKNVEIFIRQLREKLRDFDENIETVSGFGYKLNS